MNQHEKNKSQNILPLKTMFIMSAIFCLMFVITSATKEQSDFKNVAITNTEGGDSATSAQAFLQVYTVLMSPRCMNCHPSGNRPLQGDDNHIHTMNVQRGKDGKGLYAMKCSNCHQPQNTAGLHTPPGNPKWQLPPADMKMIFQGRSAHDLALQIMDYNRNGHKDKAQLLEHARDTLVKEGWQMGGDRTPPPMAYNDFVKAWDTWINNDGYAPPAKQ